MEMLAGAPAVFGTADSRSIEGDYPQDSDFRQDNDFFYLTGLEARDAWLIVNHPARGDVILLVAPRDPGEERWTGPVPGPDAETASRTGIADVRSAEELPELLKGLADRGGVARTSPGSPAGAETLAAALGPGARTVPAGPLMAQLRLVKDGEELRRLRRAVDITAEAIRESWRVAEPGVTEYELEAVVEFGFRSAGAERVGFPSIVGAGPNATILHYDKSRRETRSGELVVMDVGAEYGYYSADVTRTFPVDGRFTRRQRELYQLVLGTQEAALAAIRPGVTLAELNRVARDHMERNSGDLCGGAPCTRYFLHGLTHWLGMDVHDVGEFGTPLRPGMVITIEPGLYITEEGLGIRIEDDVLVTDSGYELLSGALPRDPEAIEAAMSEPPKRVRIRD